jgi:hypothetical protein
MCIDLIVAIKSAKRPNGSHDMDLWQVGIGCSQARRASNRSTENQCGRRARQHGDATSYGMSAWGPQAAVGRCLFFHRCQELSRHSPKSLHGKVFTTADFVRPADLLKTLHASSHPRRC